MKKLILFTYFLLCVPFNLALMAEPSNLLLVIVDEKTDQVVYQQGADMGEQLTPCSTFKIALSLIGYDTELLKDQLTPVLYNPVDNKQETPYGWIQNSRVWYSQALTTTLGSSVLKNYLKLLEYGNQDITGDPGKNNGLTQAWLNSSLKISCSQQLNFLKKLVREQLPVSKYAHHMTKNLLRIEQWDNGWQLYGKTGTSVGIDRDHNLKHIRDISWFVGWLEKDLQHYIFVLCIDGSDTFIPAQERKDIVKKAFEQVIGLNPIYARL